MIQLPNRAFNCAVLHIAGKLNPRGWAVSDVAPQGLLELKQCIAETGRITVWSGGSEKTIFGDREFNYAFRAWHDATHYVLDAEFDRPGEIAVAQRQIWTLVYLYGRTFVSRRGWASLIWCEVVGQFDYKLAYGEFPDDQMAFTRNYLTGGTYDG